MSKLSQSGGVFVLPFPIFGNFLTSVVKKETDIARKLGKEFLDKQVDKINKEYITGKDSGITLNK